jgi:diphthamide biosynthesis protein 4
MKDAYTVLGLDLEPTKISPEVLKTAYRQALLEHHPDKSNQPRETVSSRSFTVQQIREAFLILSDPEKKKEHDKRLGVTLVQTGETVDLSELEERENTDSGQLFWTRACRCGDPQGYKVTENDLIENGETEEIAVQCSGCSIWIKVIYSIE